MKSKDIVVIADTQIHAGVPVDHLNALAKFIWKHKPKHVVHIGDNWDFPSLCHYNTKLEQEGKRLVDDLRAGAHALSIIPDYITRRNLIAKKKRYKPQYHFLMGNHEERLKKMVDDNPHLQGMVDLDAYIKANGWDMHQYLEPLWLDGIAFNHYMPNPESNKAIGGTIENKLNKHNHCFVHGHQQKYQYGRRQTLDGSPHFGVCAGAFYMHDEGYRGPFNTEIRGFVHMKPFTNRFGYSDYDVDFISLERLLEMY